MPVPRRLSRSKLRIPVVVEMTLPYVVRKDGPRFVSSCPLFDLFTQGPTRSKARANLLEALQLFLISCYERGTLEKVLRDSGLRVERRPRRPRGPRSPSELPTLKVPMPLLLETGRADLWQV